MNDKKKKKKKKKEEREMFFTETGFIIYSTTKLIY